VNARAAPVAVHPPDAALLARLAAAPAIADPGPLATAWRGLVDASGVMDADAAAEEYEHVFIGMGKAPVSIYAGFYGRGLSAEHPRVRIQRDLAALGLSRPGHVTEPEDHIGGLLETLRVRAAGGAGRGPATLAEQKRFYEAHLGVALPAFVAAIGAAREANYYRHVGAVAAAFVALETESFKLD
jgi:TorA maturation chaperone TorD